MGSTSLGRNRGRWYLGCGRPVLQDDHVWGLWSVGAHPLGDGLLVRLSVDAPGVNELQESAQGSPAKACLQRAESCIVAVYDSSVYRGVGTV